jgi:hypothetical protein
MGEGENKFEAEEEIEEAEGEIEEAWLTCKYIKKGHGSLSWLKIVATKKQEAVSQSAVI